MLTQPSRKACQIADCACFSLEPFMNDISQEQGIIAAADSSFASAAEASSVLNAAVASAEQAAESLAAAEVVEIAEGARSEEHTSELQSQSNLVCRLLLEKKKMTTPVPVIGLVTRYVKKNMI